MDKIIPLSIVASLACTLIGVFMAGLGFSDEAHRTMIVITAVPITVLFVSVIIFIIMEDL